MKNLKYYLLLAAFVAYKVWDFTSSWNVDMPKETKTKVLYAAALFIDEQASSDIHYSKGSNKYYTSSYEVVDGEYEITMHYLKLTPYTDTTGYIYYETHIPIFGKTIVTSPITLRYVIYEDEIYIRTVDGIKEYKFYEKRNLIAKII